jgi:hypothetical protein
MSNNVPELIDIVEQEYKIVLGIDMWLKLVQMEIQANSLSILLLHF